MRHILQIDKDLPKNKTRQISSNLSLVPSSGRVYIGNQTKGNFYSKNHKFTKIENTTSSTQNDILAVVNSYLGLMRHFSSYKIRKRQVLKLLKSSKSSFYSFNGFLKISKKSCLKNPVFVSKTAQLGVHNGINLLF